MIERKSTLTPVGGCCSPYPLILDPLILDLVDQRLNKYLALGENAWSLSDPYESDISVPTTVLASVHSHASPATTSPATTAAVDLPFSDRNTVKRKRRYPQRQDVRDSIASRLPARSQATTHRRLRTAIARRLPPRAANQATYHRGCT